MSEELKPCPFCGRKAEVLELGDEANFGGSVVCCSGCGASSPVHFDRKENLRASWNERIRDPEKAEAVDFLKGMLGLVQLLASRDDISTELSDVLRTNHRIADALAFIQKMEGESP